MTSNVTNTGLTWYPFGTDGSEDDSLIHLGIDIPNPVGVDVHAAGDGVVIWANQGHYNDYESISAYGNVIIIEHDRGYDSKRLYTLYAHLSAILVQEGQRVATGDTIGLVGQTGQTTGPHVHFEVRLEHNAYFAVRNPDLWLAPYIGTGVIAGRLAYDIDSPVNDALITLREWNTGEVIHQTQTYTGPGVNADDNWQENFVIPNVPMGRYLVEAEYDTVRWSGEVNVIDGLTNWVELSFTSN
jgi:murein DD-endopeptidase MepM/ murein hydrolase activator NlpD